MVQDSRKERLRWDTDHGDHSHNTVGNIEAAFFLNISFTILEIVGGLMINSVAILSDALHDLGDSLSLGLSWFLENYSENDSDGKYSYGYRRFSLLGALINSLVLISGSILILFEMISRLVNPKEPSVSGMIFTAIIGIVVNGGTALRLHGDGSMNVQVVS